VVNAALRIGMNRRTCRSHQKPSAHSSAFQEFPHNLFLILGKRRGRYAGLVKLERQTDCNLMTKNRAQLWSPTNRQRGTPELFSKLGLPYCDAAPDANGSPTARRRCFRCFLQRIISHRSNLIRPLQAGDPRLAKLHKILTYAGFSVAYYGNEVL
jgi:hypothetical protein